MIADPWRGELHAYLGGIVTDLDGVPEAVGGTGDHVHLLLRLRATHELSEVLREIKRGSSAWIHSKSRQRVFAWQEGYAAFTVSPSQVAAVGRYILNQEEHHRKKTLEEEYLELLRLSGVEFDEKYLW